VTAKAVKAAVLRHGWALTEVGTTADFIALAETFGDIVPSRTGGPPVDELRPTPASDAPQRSLSAMHGLGPFPYHTDAAHHLVPPRFVFLRLASTTPTKRRTLVAPLPSRFRKRDQDVLEHDVWLVDGGRGRFLTSILGTSQGMDSPVLIRFDEGCMRPADAAFGAAREVVLGLALQNERAVDWLPARAIALDNWRTLHARDSNLAVAEDRVLERILVSES
jgi:alpha-ketoglutarate-dependent taurine dioxygenase